MNIFCNSSFFSFGKKLVANCAVLSPDKKSVPCKIYSLNPKEDLDYFDKMPNKNEWRKANYIDTICEDIDKVEYSDRYKIYTLETEDGNCLGCTEIVQNDDYAEILFLETVPSHSYRYNAKKPRMSYIGETIIAFLGKSLKKIGINKIDVYSTVHAEKFYIDKCSFKPSKKDADPFTIGRNGISRLIKQNEEHTKSAIKLVV